LWWVGQSDATGTTVTWYGNPAAGTGAAWSLNFVTYSPHAAVYGSGGEVFQYLQPVASEIPTGFTAYVPDPSGITLARWFQLAAGLSLRHEGQGHGIADIDDTLDSFFFVDWSEHVQSRRDGDVRDHRLLHAGGQRQRPHRARRQRHDIHRRSCRSRAASCCADPARAR
jgi:hypothetical protein